MATGERASARSLAIERKETTRVIFLSAGADDDDGDAAAAVYRELLHGTAGKVFRGERGSYQEALSIIYSG